MIVRPSLFSSSNKGQEFQSVVTESRLPVASSAKDKVGIVDQAACDCDTLLLTP